MIMLKERSRNIQFEAFHVFKVFVANPNKPKPILDILLRNRDKLVDFLTRFVAYIHDNFISCFFSLFDPRKGLGSDNRVQNLQ